MITKSQQAGTVLIMVLLALITAGCDSGRGSHPPLSPDQHHSHWHYTEGRGISLTPEGKTILGINLAEVVTQEQADTAGTVTIPATAILRTIRGTFVYVQNGQHYLRAPVEIQALASPDHLATDSLFEGDIVVTQGVPNLWLVELQAVNSGEACTDGH